MRNTLLALGLTALLAACSAPSNADNGTIGLVNWPGGVGVLDMSVNNNGTPVVLNSSSVDQIGFTSYKLGTPPANTFQPITRLNFGPCATISDQNAKISGVSISAKVGAASQEVNIASRKSIASLWYLERPVTISGNCTDAGSSRINAVNISFATGWNWLLITETSPNELTWTVARSLPGDVRWYYGRPTY
jgi:hypothetical protein